ncbi:MAG: PepSY domain-containing protein [Gammaproteobacteria bacterium]|nr:PepSY domain-containing protein [Gammaproteobacteria bacterium]
MHARWIVLTRRWHRWAALVLGVQLVLWFVGGLVMTAIPIEYIHGDHLAHAGAHVDKPLRPQDFAPLRAEAVAGALSVEPAYVQGRAVYRVQAATETYLLDAKNGSRLAPLSAEQVAAAARAAYTGEAPIAAVDRLTEAPAEAKRPVPLWRVRFADALSTTFYLAPADGRILAKRSTLWRAFDVFWMLHIMDYAERSDANNTLLRTVSAAGLLLALSGLVLVGNHYLRRRA